MAKFHHDLPGHALEFRHKTVENKSESKKSFKVKEVKGGKRRGKHSSKPDSIRGVEEMWTVVIGNSGEDVEELKNALVANKEMINGLSENMSCEEKTLDEMEQSFEVPSAQELEEPSMRMKDLAEMEEYIIPLSDLPVKFSQKCQIMKFNV